MRPDRLVVGEVRGAELADLLSALNTGHEGGCGTVHANSAGDVPARLEALAALGGMGRDALHAQLAAALQVLVHVRRLPDGRRWGGRVAPGPPRSGDRALPDRAPRSGSARARRACRATATSSSAGSSVGVRGEPDGCARPPVWPAGWRSGPRAPLRLRVRAAPAARWRGRGVWAGFAGAVLAGASLAGGLLGGGAGAALGTSVALPALTAVLVWRRHRGRAAAGVAGGGGVRGRVNSSPGCCGWVTYPPPRCESPHVMPPSWRRQPPSRRWVGRSRPPSGAAVRDPVCESLVELGIAWEVAERTGASLNATLDALTGRLSARRTVGHMVAAELSAPRATGRLLAVLPVAGVLLGYSFGGDPLAFLTGSLPGPAEPHCRGRAGMCGGCLDRADRRRGRGLRWPRTSWPRSPWVWPWPAGGPARRGDCGHRRSVGRERWVRGCGYHGGGCPARWPLRGVRCSWWPGWVGGESRWPSRSARPATSCSGGCSAVKRHGDASRSSRTSRRRATCWRSVSIRACRSEARSR